MTNRYCVAGIFTSMLVQEIRLSGDNGILRSILLRCTGARGGLETTIQRNDKRFMTQENTALQLKDASRAFATAEAGADAARLIFVSTEQGLGGVKGTLSPMAAQWAETHAFNGTAGSFLVVPASDGKIEAVLIGIGEEAQMARCGAPERFLGRLASALPEGVYHPPKDASSLALIAWGLGHYRFASYKSANATPSAALAIPSQLDREQILTVVEAVWFGRDLINTPASNLGPEELEEAARHLAKRHGAQVDVIADQRLLDENFPMIHAVGRASDRRPRLIDMTWQPKSGRSRARLTLVGKGICFDTGGLDLKPASAMLLMKKDMGGAASALTLAHLIMGHQLDLDLRVLIPAAENSVSGNAFRPSDILTSRSGKTVEIGNTDAEGRLVLADALTYAEEAKPDRIMTFATLTGAARVALGPELPALFSTDDAFAEHIHAAGLEIGDPVWRMPFWQGYDAALESKVADLGNVATLPFAGAITAALFLKRFVTACPSYTHIDLYGWQPQDGDFGPAGGDPQSARAVFEALKNEVTS